MGSAMSERRAPRLSGYRAVLTLAITLVVGGAVLTLVIALMVGGAGLLSAPARALPDPVPPGPESLRHRLDEYLALVWEKHEVPGLAVAVVMDGEVAYVEALGVESLSAPTPVTPESVFHLASVSKVFVATAILQFVERELIRLDVPVVEILPYFRLDDPRYTQITVEQLLSHTSGMPDVKDYGWDEPEYDAGALERYVRSLGDWKLRSAPDERFAYSNAAYEVLGDIVAKVSGVPFEDYVKAHILVPLGMRSSTFLAPEVDASLRTAPHRCRLVPGPRETFPYNRAHGPSSTLQSNVLDMARWALAILARGELDEQRILSDESFDEMWKPRVVIRGDRQMGLAWMLGDHRGIPFYTHGGRDPGFAAGLVLLPEPALGVIVLSNCDAAPVGPILKAVTDIALGYAPETPPVPLMTRLARGWRDLWE
jgi:CubicO group peptidase (beta-lactamase class C family)